ncbi:hypothetical protein [Actinoplanes sp. DH11]|uniref:hypothetical protein n=1 Tax=Actinoplanes sp. DH11 TaxID=2857011 RepID=UPI001E2E127D|nr:hypothetical protein [Actinoplanes sp. DH11]
MTTALPEAPLSTSPDSSGTDSSGTGSPGAASSGAASSGAGSSGAGSSGAGSSAPGSGWPEEQVTPRPDWRERFALGADVALIGIVTTVAALPLLTAPAALAAGSAAIRHRYREGGFGPLRPLLRQFRRGLLPGLPMLLVAVLVLADLTAVGRGWVPGGRPLLTVTAVAAFALGGLASVILVALGRAPDRAWAEAAAWAWNQPRAVAAAGAVGALTFFLALTVPATIPLIVGFHLFAAHVLTDRLSR